MKLLLTSNPSQFWKFPDCKGWLRSNNISVWMEKSLKPKVSCGAKELGVAFTSHPSETANAEEFSWSQFASTSSFFLSFAKCNPQALQTECGPSGPLLHSGVSPVPHLLHFLEPFGIGGLPLLLLVPWNWKIIARGSRELGRLTWDSLFMPASSEFFSSILIKLTNLLGKLLFLFLFPSQREAQQRRLEI